MAIEIIGGWKQVKDIIDHRQSRWGIIDHVKWVEGPFGFWKVVLGEGIPDFCYVIRLVPCIKLKKDALYNLFLLLSFYGALLLF